MSALRKDLPPLPDRMRHLPVESRGYPVPHFIAFIDGEPDFRVMDGEKLRDCVRFKRCWLCGQALGRNVSFVVGPMCAVNRTSAEPPSHRECAEFAVKACPFLSRPKAKRLEGLPEGTTEGAGFMIRRNPGVALIWTTNARAFSVFRAPGGVLFDIGEPESVSWYAEGRPATRAEVLASIDSGCPALEEMARQEGPEALALLANAKDRALLLLPAEAV